MKRGLLLPLALVASTVLGADETRCSFSFRQPTALAVIARSIATLGGFNVVVEPTIPVGLSFEVKDIPATQALEMLAKQSGCHLVPLPYTHRPTYLLGSFPRDPATLADVTPDKETEPMNFDFRKPTPVSTILKTMGAQGNIPVRWGGSMDPFIALELHEVTPMQAIQVLRDLLSLPLVQEGGGLVLGGIPPPRPPVAAAPAAPPGTDPMQRAFGNASAPGQGSTSPFPGQPPPQFKVLGITGDEPDFVAVIEYEAETYIVQPGSHVPDEWQPVFRVTSITTNKVEVFVPSMNRVVTRSY